MEFQQKQFLVRDQTPDKVLNILQEFPDKYQGFQSRWDFELLSQKEHSLKIQLVDHGYETPRAKGESDSPVYTLNLEADQQDVRINWDFRWKRSKRNLSWLLLILLIINRIAIFILAHGDESVLFMGIWMFCFVLYGAWILQNVLHDRLSMQIFTEMLSSNFNAAPEQNGSADLTREKT